MENKENVVVTANNRFYVLREKPKVISYQDMSRYEDKKKWKHIELDVELDDIEPNDDEIMYMYGDLWRLIVKKEEFEK